MFSINRSFYNGLVIGLSENRKGNLKKDCLEPGSVLRHDHCSPAKKLFTGCEGIILQVEKPFFIL